MYSVTITHWEGVSYYWESADLRMVPDEFGTLVVIPFCFGEWDLQIFDII